MPLKAEVVTVPKEWGARDAGKRFIVSEWPAMRAARWFDEFFIAVKGTGMFIPEEMAGAAPAVLAIRGLNSFFMAEIDYAKVGPLIDQLMECVQFVRDDSLRDPLRPELPQGFPPTQPGDIEEVKTVMWLRSEVVRIHTNFSLADRVLNLVRSTTALMKQSDPPA